MAARTLCAPLIFVPICRMATLARGAPPATPWSLASSAPTAPPPWSGCCQAVVVLLTPGWE